MAGTLDLVQRTFTGVRMEADALVFRPRRPGALRGLRFQLRYRDLRIAVSLDARRLQLTAEPGAVAPARVVVDDVPALLGAGQRLEFASSPDRLPRDG